jgi:hypothetical protein|tara:strand:- start:782 stop:1000 length:219 start_codon:yes stop_codon:yes gene_type:complete
MAANKRVEKLLDQKSKIERELRMMQENCSHSERAIKQVTLGEGCQTSTRWVCNECSAVVGYPSEVELEKYLK